MLSKVKQRLSKKLRLSKISYRWQCQRKLYIAEIILFLWKTVTDGGIDKDGASKKHF